MIRLETILTPGRSLVNVPGGSKKRALETVANLIADQVPELEMQDVFEKLVAREKLGSTGFGNGIAIPHCRLEGCSAPVSALLHLDAPIEYDAIDARPWTCCSSCWCLKPLPMPTWNCCARLPACLIARKFVIACVAPAVTRPSSR